MEESFIQSTWSKPDRSFEIPLRPNNLQEFIGQKKIIDRLEIFIGAAKKRKETLGHCLLSGPPGLGKTTLSTIIAQTMGTQMIASSGPAIEKAADLAGILTNMKEGDVFFIDEIHRLPRNVEEYLYTAMENYSLDLMIDSGPSARSVQIQLAPFTLIGATTRSGLLSSPLRSRFAFQARLEYYDLKTLTNIVMRTSNLLQMPLSSSLAETIAIRARGTPRIANNLFRWTRDYHQMHPNEPLSNQLIAKALDLLGIDHRGLDEMDKMILKTIIEHHKGGPVGVQTLSVALGEESHTIEEVYEPYLIMSGFLERTPRGRVATNLAYQHIGLKSPENNFGE